MLLKVQFRGREMQHIEAMLVALADVCKVEKAPSMDGKQMTALLALKPPAK